MKHRYYRWATAGLLMVGVAILMQTPLAVMAERMTLEWGARRFLRDLSLPLTSANLRRARLMTDHRVIARPRSAGLSADFAPGLPYDRLVEDGVLRLAIYLETSDLWSDAAESFAALRASVHTNDIELEFVTTAGQLAAAMQGSDIVLFLGHSNYGDGLVVRDDAGENLVWDLASAQRASRFIPPTHSLEREPFPPITAPVWIHFGCRSDVYYGDALQRHAPSTGLLLNSCSWGPDARLTEALRILLSALAERRPLGEVLREWEDLYALEYLQGQATERIKYRNAGSLSDRLFLWRPPGEEI